MCLILSWFIRTISSAWLERLGFPSPPRPATATLGLRPLPPSVFLSTTNPTPTFLLNSRASLTLPHLWGNAGSPLEPFYFVLLFSPCDSSFFLRCSNYWPFAWMFLFTFDEISVSFGGRRYFCGLFCFVLSWWVIFWVLSRQPEVLWAQRSDKIYLTVSLPDARDVLAESEPHGAFKFSAVGAQDEHFDFSLELYDAVVPEASFSLSLLVSCFSWNSVLIVTYSYACQFIFCLKYASHLDNH